MLGKHHNEETKYKISQKRKGIIMSEETKKKMSIAQQWNKLQQSGQSIEIDRKRMENEARKILNDIVISGKRLTLEQQQQLIDVILGLGGLATRVATVKGVQ